MTRWIVAAATLIGSCVLAPAASSRADVAALTKPQAIAAVRAVLRTNAASCRLRIVKMTATRAGAGWRVVATTSGGARGTSRWTVVRRPVPSDVLARRILRGCPAPPAPPAEPSPVPPAPGAPATYVFGAQLTSAQQAVVRRGLDAGARLYRTLLGRELPQFTVWAHANLDELIGAYAANIPTSPEAARSLWTGGQVAHATSRQLWFGPAWFGAGSEANMLKIAAHEAFHLLQYEIVGQRAMSVSGLDEVPRAGPWWLLEGSAEYFAYLAVVADGGAGLASVRAQWIRSAKASGATLVALSTLRGQRETPGAYDIYALATEVLLRERDAKLALAYHEAIARGVAWQDAFATTFGRTFDAFVSEFEAYRRSA